jgi:hypothetical protein
MACFVDLRRVCRLSARTAHGDSELVCKVVFILAPQPLLWEIPALAIVVNIWIAFAIVAGIPYGGVSWLKDREEW